MKVCFKVDRIFFLLFFSFSLIDLQAEVLLPSLISDNMVLKQKSKVALWGWDTPGTNVQVETGWNGKVYNAVAGADGKWSLNVSTPKAGGPFQIWIDGTNRVTLDNVMVGEVWFTSGQSNMGWSVAEEKNSENVLKNAKHDNIRLFHVPRQVSDRKEMKLRKQASWKSCDAKSVKHFSAMSYYFAVLLQEKLKSWLSYDLQESDSKLRKSIERWNAWERAYSKDSAMYAEKMLVWQKDTARGIVNKPVKKPKSVHMLERPHCKPGALYNGMVYPCMPYTISGLIWYQGENNVGNAEPYTDWLTCMIGDWRNRWNSELPFYIIQLPNFDSINKKPLWAEMRDAQSKVLAVPGTHLIVTSDLGDPYDLHPRNKQEVGMRAALQALHYEYGYSDIVSESPMFERMEINGDKVIITFKNTGSSLEIRSRYGCLQGFAIAGEDKKFHWALGELKNNRIVIWSPKVPNPVAVRYNWENNPDGNLYNKDGLPACLFRTDNW